MAEDGTPPTAAGDASTASGDWPSLVYQGFMYPYQREPGSYLFVNGAVYPYMHITDQLLGDSTVRLPDRSEISVSQLLASLGLAQLVGEHLKPAVGYGSNPAPSQLARKYAAQSATGHAVIPVMKGHLSDYDVVWTPVFVGYGAMPATITPSPGTEVDVWITWLTDRFVKTMSESEHAGKAESGSQSLYAFATLENAQYAFDGPDPDELKAYVSCFGALSIDGEILAVAAVAALGRNFRAIDSADALKAVAPTIGWRGSVLDLLYANVSEPQKRATRSDKLRPLGVIADDPNVTGMEACKGSRSGPEKPF
jgi:hypothetical protein